MESDFKRDPWVKVGTTTIDGTLVDIATMLDVSSWPIDWDRDAEGAIDLFVRASEPWLIGGRHLLAKGSHINGSRGTALIRCDVVRRQSEIDEEMMRSVAPSINELSATMRRMDPCPECGPHGNRGEVLLASSWAKCTTCAGGKPGDLWGEVNAEKPPLHIFGVDVNANPSYEELRTAMSSRLKDFEIACGMRGTDGRSFMDARREALADQHGQGFKVPTAEEFENYLQERMMAASQEIVAEYNDETISRWRAFIEQVAPVRF